MASVLRTSLPSGEERAAAGRALRDQVKRGDLGKWPAEGRPDPIDLIEEAHEGRLQRLIPVRVGRMMASPYAFLRGSAALMAEDFAHLPRTGIEPVICGDAHLGNFGFYASPERDLVFDLNDFDEAHPGPGSGTCTGWPASGWPAAERPVRGHLRGRGPALRLRLPAAAPPAGRPAAAGPVLRPPRHRPDAGRAGRLVAAGRDRAGGQAGPHRTSDRALPKLTRERGGTRHIVDQPPLITHVSDRETAS